MVKKSDYYIGRREFVAGVVGVLGAIMSAVVGLPLIGYIVAPALQRSGDAGWVPLGALTALQPGVPTPLTFSRLMQVGWKRAKINRTAYAILDEANTVTVLSDVCTHLSCRVRWVAEQGVFACPCHEAIFDCLGNVVSGPPPRPLDRFQAKIENDQLLIWVED
jgi:quinol---cytochrome c reductase iron-sulfur subunit, bacillus type